MIKIKKALKQFFIALTCVHEEQEFISNVYGDTVHDFGCRALYQCERCGTVLASQFLNPGHLKRADQKP